MPDKRDTAIRRRILPFTPLELMLEEPGGGHFKIDLKLAFDMNAGAAIQERTADPHGGVTKIVCSHCGKMNDVPDFRGYTITDPAMWYHIAEPRLLKAMLWGAMLAHQPQYDSDEGFEAVGTFIQESNAEKIFAALEKAYHAYLPKERVELILKFKAAREAEAAAGDAKGAGDDETGRPLAETSQGDQAAQTGSISGRSLATTSDSASKSSAA